MQPLRSSFVRSANRMGVLTVCKDMTFSGELSLMFQLPGSDSSLETSRVSEYLGSGE